MWVRCDRVKQIREEVSGDRFEGDFLEEGLSSCIQSLLEYLHRWSVHAICSSTGFLEHWTHVVDDGFYTAVSESRKYDREAQTGWGQEKLRRVEIREYRFFVRTNKVNTDSSTDKGKELQPLVSCLMWDVAQPFYQLHYTDDVT